MDAGTGPVTPHGQRHSSCGKPGQTRKNAALVTFLCTELTAYQIIVVKGSSLPEDQQAGSKFVLVNSSFNACSFHNVLTQKGAH